MVTYTCVSPFLLQTPPEKQQRPKSLQLGDRRLTLSLFQGVSSQLSLSNPLSPLPASPQPLHTPRSSSMSLTNTTLHVVISFALTIMPFTQATKKYHACLLCVNTFWSTALIRSDNNWGIWSTKRLFPVFCCRLFVAFQWQWCQYHWHPGDPPTYAPEETPARDWQPRVLFWGVSSQRK